MTAPVGRYYTGSPIARELAQEVARLRPARGVLDPTCGAGALLDAVHELLPDMPLYGMDRDPEAVAACRAKGYDAVVGDSLFDPLPGDADVWIANPPYLGGKKIGGQLGVEYQKRLRAQWPQVHGNADYCVYWLRRADDLPGVRAVTGVYTNTIAQGDTRASGLRYLLVESEAFWEITWAWRRRRWEGDKANVIVSLVTLERPDVVASDEDEEPLRAIYVVHAPPWTEAIGPRWRRGWHAEVWLDHGALAHEREQGLLWRWRTCAGPLFGSRARSAEEGRQAADEWLTEAGVPLDDHPEVAVESAPDPEPEAAQLGLFGEKR